MTVFSIAMSMGIRVASGMPHERRLYAELKT